VSEIDAQAVELYKEHTLSVDLNVTRLQLGFEEHKATHATSFKPVVELSMTDAPAVVVAFTTSIALLSR
jgi:hypothetical protein